ncbi:MAG TPA: EF-hand domain-containing protein [Albitalea sp.]|uniref:EF-hand domain-containing protein n=1 Tax=Piscinibacter sp. TaxID=1903157 RepID=UPI002ED14C9C
MRRWLAALILLCGRAHAGDEVQQVPLRDPWVPPSVSRAASVAPETRGAALQAQVERKLRASFEAADVNRRGSITREEARAAGLGFVAEHFERIDVRGSGRVSFEDLKRYLDARR